VVICSEEVFCRPSAAPVVQSEYLKVVVNNSSAPQDAQSTQNDHLFPQTVNLFLGGGTSVGGGVA